MFPAQRSHSFFHLKCAAERIFVDKRETFPIGRPFYIFQLEFLCRNQFLVGMICGKAVQVRTAGNANTLRHFVITFSGRRWPLLRRGLLIGVADANPFVRPSVKAIT